MKFYKSNIRLNKLEEIDLNSYSTFHTQKLR